MELLRELRPADIMGFSCLVSALAELCFSIHPCYVPYPIASASSSSSVREGEGEGEGEGGSGEGSLVVPLGAVDDKLRVEAGTHLLSLLRPPASGSPSASASASAPSLPQRPPLSSSTPATMQMAEVVCRRFVMDICEQPLQLRCAALRQSPSPSPSQEEGQGDGPGAGAGAGAGLGVGEEGLQEFVEQLCGRSSSLSPTPRPGAGAAKPSPAGCPSSCQ